MPVDEPNPLQADLAAHAETLIPGGAEQLAMLWENELKGVSPAVRKELIAARLADPRYAHFKRAAGTPAASAPGAGGDKPPTVSDALIEQSKAQQAASGNPYGPGGGMGRGGFRSSFRG
jgi:hypothetical protein